MVNDDIIHTYLRSHDHLTFSVHADLKLSTVPVQTVCVIPPHYSRLHVQQARPYHSFETTLVVHNGTDAGVKRVG